MRTTVLWPGASPGRPRLERGVAEASRGLAGFVGCVTLCLGVSILDASSPAASPLSNTATGFWACVFGTSVGVRILVRAQSHGRGRLGVPRMVCATFGFMAWSQLSWAVLQPALARLDAATSGTVAGGVAAYAAVALMELRAIYKAAQDARSHDA